MCFTNIWQHLQLSSTLYVCAYMKVHNIHACWYVVDVFIYCKIGYFDLRIIKIKKEIFLNKEIFCVFLQIYRLPHFYM